LNGQMSVGANATGNAATLKENIRGRIDDFAVWSGTLDATQIASLSGGTSTAALVGIPEPSTGLLVLLSGLLIVRRRR